VVATCNNLSVLDADFIVIGGGIAGASAAYELSARGQVILLERESAFDYHTTGRSAAVFTESYHRGVHRALIRSSRPFLEHPPEGFVDSPVLSPLSLLYVGRQEQRDALEEIISHADDVELERIEGSDLQGVCPVLAESIVLGALEPGAREFDVHALHMAFLRGMRQRGGRSILQTGVDSLTWDDKAWHVQAGDTTMSAPVVVNAAGAWGDEIAAAAGLPLLDLVAYRRTAFVFSAPEGYNVSAWPMVRDLADQYYFRPEATQLLASPYDQTPMLPHDVRHEEIDVALGIERIEAATTMQIRHVRRAWAGLRTFAPDHLPVAGFDPDHPGFFWLVGQGGNGIQTASTLARVTAGLITEGVIPAELVDAGVDEAALAPARFRD